MAVIAIILVQFDRKVDIVTSNLQLAFRDEKEQSEYYKLFGIDSGVLCKKDGDKEYIDVYKVDYRKINTNHGFYTHILQYPIIYSTNYNYEFLELYSIFRSEPIRKRKYDVVLIDEVDNMLLDQVQNPAIVGYSLEFFSFSKILKEIYDLKDLKEEMILTKMKNKFRDLANLNLNIISKLKYSARNAQAQELDVHYIIEDGKCVIIDNTTGYKKPGQRWNSYVHEITEIKEGLSIESPTMAYCSMSQNIFFNKYEKIGGLTGTLGDPHDIEVLKNNYHIDIFN